MRAGIGLLALLIGACVIFWISFGPMGGNAKHGYEGEVLTQGKNAQQQANQVSGHDENGVPVSESIKLEEVDVDGHLRRLKVNSVVAGGPFDTAYKLRAGDEITEIGDMNVRDNDNGDLAKALVYEAYGRNQPLSVQRDGRTVKMTPDSPLTQFHPEMFGKPGATAVPSH